MRALFTCVSLELYTVNDIHIFSVIFIPFTELVVFHANKLLLPFTTERCNIDAR